MAKKSSEPCIFCGECPCQCNKKPVKTVKKPRKLTVETVVAPILTPEPNMLDAMRKAAAHTPKRDLSHLKDPPRRSKASSPQGYPQPMDNKPAVKPVIETDINDLLFADAIRNLAPILHADEIEKYKVLITSQPSGTDRARVWRARRYG